jgi:stage V sporulation protein AF
MRVMILALVYLFGVWGFSVGFAIFIFCLATNVSVTGKRHYLYPLVPFDGRALARHFLRFKKDDFEDGDQDFAGN